MTNVGALETNRNLVKNTSVVKFNFKKEVEIKGFETSIQEEGLFFKKTNKTTTPTHTKNSIDHSYDYKYADTAHDPFISHEDLGDTQVVALNNQNMYAGKTYENIRNENSKRSVFDGTTTTNTIINDINLQVTTALPVSVIAHYMKKIASALNTQLANNKLNVTKNDNKVSYVKANGAIEDISEVNNINSIIEQHTNVFLNRRNENSAKLENSQNPKNITITTPQADPMLWAHIAHLAVMNAERNFTQEGQGIQQGQLTQITVDTKKVCKLEHDKNNLDVELTTTQNKITTAQTELDTLNTELTALKQTKTRQEQEAEQLKQQIEAKTKEKKKLEDKQKKSEKKPTNNTPTAPTAPPTAPAPAPATQVPPPVTFTLDDAKTLGKLEAEIKQAKATQETKQAEIAKTTAEIAKKNTAIANKNTQINELTGSQNTLSKQITDKNTEITTAQNALSTLWTTLATLEGQYGLDKTAKATKEQEIKQAWQQDNTPETTQTPATPVTPVTPVTKKSTQNVQSAASVDDTRKNAQIIGISLLCIAAVCCLGFPILRKQLSNLAPQ